MASVDELKKIFGQSPPGLIQEAPVRTQYVTTEPINVEGYITPKKVAPAPAPVAPKKELPVKDKVQVVAAQTPKVEQNEIVEVKKNFAPEQLKPEEVQQAAQPEVKREPSSRGPGTDFWLGLLPIATDLLTGNTGAGYNIASKYYLGEAERQLKRGQSLEDKLLELEKERIKKNGAKERRYQLKSVEDKDSGEKFPANYDSATGELYSLEGTPLNAQQFKISSGLSFPEVERRAKLTTQEAIKKGKALGTGVRTIPGTGLLGAVRNEQIVPIESAQSLNPTQIKNLEKVTSKFTSSQLYKDNIKKLESASLVDSLFAEAMRNPTAMSAARKELAKMAEGGGKLTDRDVEMIQGSMSIRDQARRWANQQKEGVPLLPEDVAFLKQVADILQKDARRKLQNAVQGLEQDFIQKGGVPGAVGTSMKAYIPESTTPTSRFPMTVRKGTKKATISNEKELKEAMSEGWQ